jgi:hypothetical protein
MVDFAFIGGGAVIMMYLVVFKSYQNFHDALIIGVFLVKNTVQKISISCNNLMLCPLPPGNVAFMFMVPCFMSDRMQLKVISDAVKT